jgi:hypothetical protein
MKLNKIYIALESLFKFYKNIKLKYRVSFIQLKPVFDVFLRGFSLFSYSVFSLKFLLLPNLKVSYRIYNLYINILARIPNSKFCNIHIL